MAAQHQHYIPQLLLRGFLSRDPDKASKEQVHVFDLQRGQPFATSITNIMGERRFNDFWLDEETLASIEPAAGRIESHVAPLIERIRTKKWLNRTVEEKEDLGLLMAFQFIRTRKMRLLPKRIHEQMKAAVKDMGLDPENGGTPAFDENALKLEHVRNQLNGLADYTQLIAEKEFFLMTAPKGSTFYLSDHPVVLHNDEERRGVMGRLGLGVAYIQIYLPLSADVLLCAYDPAVLGQLMRSRDEGMKEIQLEALDLLQRGRITAEQMKQTLDEMKASDLTTQIIEATHAGKPIAVGPKQVQFYNSLQAAQAHRFVVDPDGKFVVASEIAARNNRASLLNA